jgi:hypothetical protein
MRKLLTFLIALAVTVGVSASSFGGSMTLLGVGRAPAVLVMSTARQLLFGMAYEALAQRMPLSEPIAKLISRIRSGPIFLRA